MNFRSTVGAPAYPAGVEYSEELNFSGGRESASTTIPGLWIFLVMAASMVSFVAIMAHAELGILLNAASILFAVGASSLCLVRYIFRRPTERRAVVARDLSEYVLIFAVVSLLGATASYAVAASTTGWVDTIMQDLDALIGFDWVALYRFVASHPVLQVGGMAVYANIFLTPAILLGSFAFTGQRAEARHFLASFWLAAVLSLTLFRFMPTLGPLAFLWHGPIPYMPTSGLYQADLIPLLRDHSLQYVDLGTLRGLVGPPSFHAASAVLYILAARRMRRFRAPVIAVNLAMLLSIPVEGTHYVVDVIGGIIVALIADFIITRMTRKRPVVRLGSDAYPLKAPC